MPDETVASHLADALGHAIADKRLEVLRRVGQTGSISQAAREAGISYKAAWQAIDTLTNLSGVALVERSVGGPGGGGARLTAQGERLLVLAQALGRARDGVLQAHGLSLGVGVQPLERAAGGLGLRTSMRNQLPVTVVQLCTLPEGGGAVEVALQAAGGGRLCASVTAESADLLGLVPGLPVVALCKATAVAIKPGAGAWGGLVERFTPGGGRIEVVLALAGGGHWVGFADQGFAVPVGGAAHAVMAPSAVVIGLNG